MQKTLWTGLCLLVAFLGPGENPSVQAQARKGVRQALEVTPQRVDLGAVGHLQKKDFTFTITNRGTEPLVSWTDLADRAIPIFSRAIILDLGLLDPGEYVLEFTVSVPGQRPIVRTAPVILEGPPGG